MPMKSGILVMFAPKRSLTSYGRSGHRLWLCAETVTAILSGRWSSILCEAG